MKDIQEHFEVIGAAAGGITASYANMEEFLRVLILVGTAVYVWRRALKKRKRKDDDETTTT